MLNEAELQSKAPPEVIAGRNAELAERPNEPEENEAESAERVGASIEEQTARLKEEGEDKLKLAEETSGLDDEKITVARERLQIKPKLAEIARTAKEVGKEAKFKVASFLAAHTSSYKARSVKNEMLREQILALSETDLAGAIAQYAQEVKAQKNPETGYSYFKGVIDHALQQKLDKAVDQKFAEGLDEGMAYLASLPPTGAGWAVRQARRKIEGFISEGAYTDDEIKSKIIGFPLLAHEVRNTQMYGGRNIFSDADIPALVKEAIRTGDSPTTNQYIWEINYYHKLPQFKNDREFVDSLFSYCLQQERYTNIVGHLNIFRSQFDALPKTERENIVENIYTKNPEYLDALEGVIAMNKWQKQRIVETWLKRNHFSYILNEANRTKYNIDEKIFQAALNRRLREEKGAEWLVKNELIQQNITLSADQKEQTINSLLENHGLQVLLSAEAINGLSLTEEQVKQYFERYTSRHNYSSGARYNSYHYGQMEDSQKRELCSIIIEHSGYHPWVQKYLTELVNKDDASEGVKKLFALTTEKIVPDVYKEFFGSEQFMNALRNRPDKAREVAEMAPQYPWLVRYPRLQHYLLRRPEELQQVKDFIDDPEFSKLFLTEEVVQYVLNYPDKRDFIKQLSNEHPDLIRSHLKGTLQRIVEEDANAETFLKLFQKLPDPHDNVLVPYLDFIAKHPQWGPKVLEITDRVPSLFQGRNSRVIGIILENESQFERAAELVEAVNLPLSFDFSDFAKLEGASVDQRTKYFDFYLLHTTDTSQEFCDILCAAALENMLTAEQETKLAKRFNYLPLSKNAAQEYKVGDTTVDEKNWARILSLYIAMEGDEDIRLPEDTKKEIQSLFAQEETENKDFCLGKMQNYWREFLDSADHQIAVQAGIIADTIHSYEGAGPLKYIDSLGGLMHQVKKNFADPKIAARTRQELVGGFKQLEARFTKEKWTEDEKSVFYDLSKDVLQAAPSLYTDFINLFQEFGPKEMQEFVRLNFPLYQAELVILQKTQNEKVSYSPRSMAGIRKHIDGLKKNVSGLDRAGKLRTLAEARDENIAHIQSGFKERFGLVKIPDQFDAEKIRSIQDMVRYLGNINDRSTDSENKLALFLGLMLNNQWQQFRAGANIELDGYFEGPKLEQLKRYQQERGANNVVTAENLGISPNDLPEFQRILQDETVTQLIGNVETIDAKLGNVVRNLEDLADEDLYADPQQRAIFQLLREHGKQVNAVLAKCYQASSRGVEALLNDQEQIIRKAILETFDTPSLGPEEIKLIQDEIKTPNLIANILRDVESKNVSGLINELQNRLQPGREIIDIFNRLGEEFKQESGAMALNQDLTYLENLIVKNDDKLSDEEKQALRTYLNEISEQLGVLETTLTDIKSYYEKIEKSAHTSSNEILKERLAEVGQLIYSRQTSTAITTRVTNNMNLIIENMRQCLGCLSKQINNDTNLTFGDSNKFYIMSQGSNEKGSVADEILFFEPTTFPDGHKEMTFVLDRVYGTKSSDILISNIIATHKKYSALKAKFPEAAISILVTQSAMASVGPKAEQIKNTLAQHLGAGKFSSEEVEKVKVDVAKSASSDHYIEFGGGEGVNARTVGEREVNGLVIR